MPTCNQCETEMEWGMEYQLDTPDDHDCLCPECYSKGSKSNAR